MNIKRGIAARLLKSVPVSDTALTDCGFIDRRFGSLEIFFDEGFYYYGLTGERVGLSNMHEVSNLVYGVTPFLVLQDAQ